MTITKYKAKIRDTDVEIIGFIIPKKMPIGVGIFSNTEIDYIMYVNEFSMPNSIIRGGFLIDKDTIEVIND